MAIKTEQLNSKKKITLICDNISFCDKNIQQYKCNHCYICSSTYWARKTSIKLMLFFALNRCNFVRSQYNEERQIGIEFLGNTCPIYKNQFSDQRMFMQRFHYILYIILPVSKVINSIPLSPLNVSQMLNALDQSGHFQILIISPVK